jgi:hypothetical protein
MANAQALEKNTKYLIFFVVLLLLAGIGFVVNGLIRPWLSRAMIFYQSPQIEISEDFLGSSDLSNLSQFYHIAYPEKEIGRNDILSWPEESSTEF